MQDLTAMQIFLLVLTIIGAILAIVCAVAVFAIIPYKYLKTCVKRNFNPINCNIVLAVLSLTSLVGISYAFNLLTDSQTIQSVGSGKWFFVYLSIIGVLFGLGCLIFNIRNTYKKTQSIVFSILTFFLQLELGLIGIFTLGLGLFAGVAIVRNFGKNNYDL